MLEIQEKPRETWTREEARFVDANIPSEVKREIQDLDRAKIEKYTAKNTLQKIIKEKKASIKELESVASGASLYMREKDISGEYTYYRVR